ncbi:MAG TPA: hypothetical protein DEP01_01995, partial [Aminobacterium sp.]|nr:hypothetical protein [Aminobacterium sp.]
IVRRIEKGFFSLHLIAQGTLILFLTQHFGNPAFLNWVGIAMATVGILLFFNQYMFSQSDRQTPIAAPVQSSKTTEESHSIPDISRLPLPSLIANSKGTVLSANDPFLSLMPPESSKKVIGESISETLPLNSDTVALGGKSWDIQQKQGGDDLFFFFLTEENTEYKQTSTSDPISSILDPATGLYTKSFGERRLAEELDRAQRYRRWLSAALFKLDFHYGSNNVMDMEENEKDFLDSFGTYVIENVRECDLCMRMGAKEIIVLMPETPQNGAKELALRLSRYGKDAGYDHVMADKAHIHFGISFFSGNEKITSQDFVQSLYAHLA